MIRSNLRTRVCTQADWNMSLPSTGDDESVHINKDRNIQAVIGCQLPQLWTCVDRGRDLD